MPGSDVDWQAVDGLAKEVVAQVAPAELPVFGALADRYRADPVAAMTTKPGADDALGFGVETAVVLVSPFVIELVKRVLTKVAEEVGDQAGESLATRIAGRFRRDAKDAEAPGAQASPERLTPEQLALVAQIAREQAVTLNLPDANKDALVNGVVAALALAT